MSKILELRSICDQEMKSRGWDIRPDLVKRLNEEIADIEARDESDFFMECRERKEIYENENNLLTTYLIGICEKVNLEEPSACDYGEFPDIDVDFIPKIRDILKEEFAPNHYGKQRVCNIATYGKFGIRSALIDTARVLGLDRKEILNLTTNLSVKDDEGETLSWDKAIELYPDLRKYLEEHPDLAKAANRLLNRIRQIGVHASGLIISGVTIDDFVPLVKPKQDGQVASAWVEGLSGSDLGAVGLVKFDFLGLDALQKIGESCHLASMSQWKNWKTDLLDSLPEKICAVPGGTHFSDDSYLNDPKSLAMASRGELKMVFQFDGSPGIRQLARQANVDRFEDLMALTSLYRPGPIACLERNTKIQSSIGEIPIFELSPAEHKIAYLSQSGIKTTNNFVVQRGKKKPMFRVRTKSGKELVASADHPIMNANGEFVSVSKLKKDDVITVFKCTDQDKIQMAE